MEFPTLHEKFSDIARRLPDKTAVEWGEQTITYAGLEARANQIANVLAGKVGEKRNVPVILENSIELVAVLLGCMKAGVVFVPLDPTFPENRIKLMLGEVDAEWVITRTAWLPGVEQMVAADQRMNILLLDGEPFANAPTVSTHTSDTPTRHCYIYFTSGSTGKPKAILGRHRSLKHFIDWEIKEFQIDESFRVSQLVTPSFDAILRDIFVPLCAGATLCIPEKRETVLTAGHLKDWLESSQITLTHMVPTLFKGLMTEVEESGCFPKLRYILLAGELLRGNDIKKFFQLFGSRIELVNLYGATETTLVKLFYRVQASDVERVSVPVGKPMEGAQVMVLNNDLQICVPGSIGEIYIRTPFTSEGYYKNPEATRKVFLKNPFNDNPKDYIYKTGDLGMILPSGDVEVLGRADHQVKVRGVRIELGEIENQLLTLPAIQEAIVVAREDAAGNKYLSAYVVLAETAAQKPTTGDLREFLRANLPEYMIPAYIITLDALPLTPNGKIDRKALPDPETAHMSAVPYRAPETETEATLVRIWAEVLGKDGFGIEHNFFELGGHSLKAANVVTKVHQAFNVDVPLKTIFQQPTIRELAQYIAAAAQSTYSAIRPVEAREHYPVSSAQRRLFVLNQLERAGVTYNMPRILTVQGAVNRERLEQSMQALIQRHATLRTSFTSVDGEVRQKVHDRIEFHIQYWENTDTEVPQIIREFIRPFQLDKAPLLRVGLVQVAVDQYVLLFDTHHIISDGTSMDLLVRDFVALYQGKDLPELPVQYVDFAVWQNELFASGSMERQEKYWFERFRGSIPVLNLPTDYIRPATQTFEGDRLRFATDSELASRLQTLAKTNGTTLYMVLLAAYNVLLAKYTGQNDIVVGSPIAGRSHADLQNIIGMFVNTLAMRNFPQAELSFRDFLQEVKENALRAFECQDYQFEQLVNQLQIPRDLSRNPLFDTMLVLHNNVHAGLEIEGLKFGYYPLEGAASKFDLTLNAEEWNGMITFYLEYSTRLFKRETMQRFADHYLTILAQVAANAGIGLAEIDMLLPDEKERILKVFNNTQVAYPQEMTVQALIEEQVQRTPDKAALYFEGHELTYAQMNTAANQLARHLRVKGVQAETVVAIMVERSLEMLVGIIAILKAGGAYLPIDPDYPADRTRYVLEDSGATLVLTQEKYVPNLSAMGVEPFRIDELSVYAGDGSNLPAVSGPDSLAYLIYTSGSTGKPKGVMIEQRAVVNFITGITQKIDFTRHSSILALTTISFDIFGLETLLPLTTGLKVLISNDEQQKDTKALDLIIRKMKVDMLQMTPSRMRMLLNDSWSAPCLKDVKVLMIGGEAFPTGLLEEIRGITDAKIYNMYGPTETTIWSAIKDLSGLTAITIGQPIANTAVYILGPGDRLQPIGIPGELCIAGDGLARGYWNKPELTAEKFAPNPFAAEPDLPVRSERIYRTGDMARWLQDGEIAFGGRLDQQVKVRGYRIELGEIESRLVKHETIKEAIVVARDDGSGSNYLCAYVVLMEAGCKQSAVSAGENDGVQAGREVAVSSGAVLPENAGVAAGSTDTAELAELKVVELKAFLAKELPEYMIPNYFIPIQQIPYTPNGKIDRKALPEPDAGMITGVEFVAPGTEVETKLVQIWEEVLGVEGIGINHNFFDIGGNSINIIKVISLISQRFGVQISMSELFLHPTIAEVAHNLFMENPLKGLECVVSLNKPTEGKKNVFIIHNWSGIVYQFKEFAKALEGEYNIYGIQAKGIMKPARLPETLEEMITEYIVEMKTIQSKGPYIIAGYCYGNWLGYKMVEMLENRGVPIDRLVMIDENAFLTDKLRKALRVKTEALRPYKFVQRLVRFFTQRHRNPMDCWPELEAYRQSRPQVEGEVRNDRTVRDNIGFMCTKGYLLDNLISTDVYVIKSEENNLVRYTPEDWRKQTAGKVWFTEIPGGHESIFAYPYLDGLVTALRRALEE